MPCGLASCCSWRPEAGEAAAVLPAGPGKTDEPPEQLADRYRAAEVAPTVPLDSMPPIGFIICGGVAVIFDGVRVGKGAGYTDIEVACWLEPAY
jgi:5-formyltetrahydrofolate cyclo-ligase